jgi:hypothetical protein
MKIPLNSPWCDELHRKFQVFHSQQRYPTNLPRIIAVERFHAGHIGVWRGNKKTKSELGQAVAD